MAHMQMIIVGMAVLQHLHVYIAYKEQMLYITAAEPAAGPPAAPEAGPAAEPAKKPTTGNP